jgi:glycosyltransferase involved in cell wall biosynthesis
MDILFIHGNYPAQFVHLASGLAAQQQHRVIFLTESNCTNLKQTINGVTVELYERHREASASTHPYLVSTESAILNGQAVVRAIADLQTSLGFQPRLVFSHAGNGLGLFIRDLCPDALHISYTEWYFKPELSHYLLGLSDLDTRLRAKCRNLVILQELECCDLAVTPTNWQRSQFPEELQAKIHVVFDGVDLNYFHPPTSLPGPLELSVSSGETVQLEADDLVLSYATRGMEPLRGFPELMRALPDLLQRFPHLKVVIAGQDRRAYSYDAPSHDGSWKNHMMAKLDNLPGFDRVFFTGLLNYGEYRSLLHRSDLHVYFTRPYVLSWGYMQAAACGCRLLVNHSPAIEDIPLTQPAVAIDLDDHIAIVKAAVALLNTATAERAAQRRTLLDPQMGLIQCLERWQNLINDALHSGSRGLRPERGLKPS